MLKRQHYFFWVFISSILLFSFLLALCIHFIIGIDPDEISTIFTGGNPIAEFMLMNLFVLLMTLPLLNQFIPTGLYRQTIGIIFSLAGLGLGVAYLYSENFTDLVALLENIGVVLFVILMFVGFAMQKVRNIAVLIVLVTLPFLLILQGTFLIAEIVDSCVSMDFISEDLQSLLFLVGIPLIVFFFWAVWRMILWSIGKLVEAYNRKLFSDFQLQTVLWLVLIAYIFSAGLGKETGENEATHYSIYPALVLVFCVSLFEFLMRRVAPWDAPKKLLYLRVFDTSKNSERLFNFVSRYWRHIGPINMIGGPDFALMNLDINEAYYLLFKRKQIHELFIDEPAALVDRLQHMSYKPSSDRQYSVNEFFCTDNMWKEAVTRLLEQADHVLLDLRGFNNERMGAAFELQLLSKMDLLQYTTVVVDSQTDWSAIKQALDTRESTLLEDQVISLNSRKMDKQVLLHLATT